MPPFGLAVARHAGVVLGPICPESGVCVAAEELFTEGDPPAKADTA
jgi:hypothetical protein